MSIKLSEVEKFVKKSLRDTDFYKKAIEMMQYVVDQTNEELKDVTEKLTNPMGHRDEVIKEILNEKGMAYIVGVMDTVEGFEFNNLLSFIDMIKQLKGTRKGLELVLKLLGFDSIINEWWENENSPGEPLTYEIIVIVNSSLVPDIFSTLDKIKIFSEHYVLAKISNIDVRFSADKFAELGAIMGGFEKPVFTGRFLVRAFS